MTRFTIITILVMIFIAAIVFFGGGCTTHTAPTKPLKPAVTVEREYDYMREIIADHPEEDFIVLPPFPDTQIELRP